MDERLANVTPPSCLHPSSEGLSIIRPSQFYFSLQHQKAFSSDSRTNPLRFSWDEAAALKTTEEDEEELQKATRLG